MRRPSTDEAYADGLEAAYRIGKYEGFKTVPDCPYEDGTPEDTAWWDGLDDGTEALIRSQTED